MKTKTPETISALELAAWTGLTRRRIDQLAGDERVIPPPVRGRYPMPETIQRLFKHYRHDGESVAGEKLKLLAAKRRLLERKDRLEERQAGDEWVSREAHFKILTMLTDRLEAIPGNAKSMLGLADVQTDSLRKMLDSARAEASEAIRNL